MSDIWSACQGERHIAPLQALVHRVVESQEKAATLGLVDTLEEQSRLEELLEATKPDVPPAARGLDYLLMTPFRYPPLRYGSRFGGRTEPGIFYASWNLRTALSESAYYQIVFMDGMKTPPPDGTIRTQLTAFRAKLQSQKAVLLDQPPFDRYRTQISSPADYGASQALGSALREAGVEAARYVSARDPEHGLNVAVFSPDALGKKHRTPQSWTCTTTSERVVFVRQHGSEGHEFERGQFLVDGTLPYPRS